VYGITLQENILHAFSVSPGLSRHYWGLS